LVISAIVSAALPLDVADARILLFNVVLARQANAAVGIRFSDEPGTAAAAGALDICAWLGFADDVEPLPAGARAARYHEAVQHLRSRGRALLDAAGAVILPLEPGRTVIVDDVKGAVVFENAALGDLVLVDAAGSVNPAFAEAVDAVDCKTAFVLREDRELERTALQQHVYAALDGSAPRAAHVGVLLPDGDALPVLGDLRQAGIEPAALIDHLALLGWSPPAPQESFSLAELTAQFSLDRLGAAPAHFNAVRLQAFNRRALRALPRAELSDRVAAVMQRAGLLEAPVPEAARRWIETFLEAFGDGFANLNEALALVAELRAEAVLVPALELERLRNRQVLFYLDAVGQYVDAQPELRGLPLDHDLRAIAQEFGIAGDDALGAVRMALTGKHAGPPLHLLFVLLGHDRILIRIGAISSHLLHGRGLEPIKYGPGGVPFQTIQTSRPAPD
jgi:glutamyl/glutaminyl-tRNA synthetase